MIRTMTKPPDTAEKKPRTWSPRFWEGCDYFAWLRMFASNRGAVEPPFWYISTILFGTTFINTVLKYLQSGLHGRAIDRTEFVAPPIFVLGHWRTGTTLLHELLILDERFTSPTTLQCFEPCHFLLSEGFFRTRGKFLLPDKRPMDNMAAGWDRPQEDEFALALLGQPSTYTDFAFPKRKPMWPGSLDLSGLNARQLRDWKRAFVRFLRTVQYRDPRRLVLKSPPHTARIPVLLELFPEAKFVAIRRDPYTLFPSTVNLWMSLAKQHGLQAPVRNAELEEKVFREFITINERYEADRRLIPPGHLVEVKYEEFVRDLVGGVEAIYRGWNLDGFAEVESTLKAFAAGQKNYETNKYTQSDDERRRITERWGPWIEKQGYQLRP